MTAFDLSRAEDPSDGGDARRKGEALVPHQRHAAQAERRMRLRTGRGQLAGEGSFPRDEPQRTRLLHQKLDRVFGNRLIRFLSAISYNFYIWHQFLAVKLKELHIPAYTSEFPQMNEGRAWQTNYTLLCFAAAFLLAAALTFFVEKPAGRALLRLRERKEKV